MRKTAKAALAHALLLDNQGTDMCSNPTVYVLDGGHLLHAFIWKPGQTYQSVIDQYLMYINNKFKNKRVIVVFDGYGDQQTTQSLEQRRRAAN